MEKWEDQQKDIMRVVKLMQAYSESQDDENTKFKEQISQLTKEVRDIKHDKKQDEAKFKEELKSEFSLDLKALGKELAIDIISLNKKLDSKVIDLTTKHQQLSQEYDSKISKLS